MGGFGPQKNRSTFKGVIGDLGFRVLDRDILGHIGFRNYAFKRCDRGIIVVYFDI